MCDGLRPEGEKTVFLPTELVLSIIFIFVSSRCSIAILVHHGQVDFIFVFVCLFVCIVQSCSCVVASVDDVLLLCVLISFPSHYYCLV